MNPASTRQQGDRFILLLDHAGWRWTNGRTLNPGTGDAVALPHCWNAHQEYLPGGEVGHGWATYALDFNLPEMDASREWRLRCDGFYGVGQAFLNGGPVGRFNGDYLGIDLNVTNALQTGLNRMTIQVCNRPARNILPGIPDPDFHLYGGLGGGMHLAALPRVRLARGQCQVTMAEDRPADICAGIGMVNHGDRCATRSLQVLIRDCDGRIVAQPPPVDVVLSPDRFVRQELRCAIPSPQWWSLEEPNLYAIELLLRHDGQVLDRLSWNFGLRTARFDSRQGFLLNGRPVPLRGLNRHENLPGFGFALPRTLAETEASRIKQMGLNFVRLSHYPQSPEFLYACDRVGILVLAELCSWKRIRGGSWLAAAETQLERMIRRDRHHPSIILWGLGNEGRHRQAFLRLTARARSLDPTRPTIYAENHAYRARREKTAGLTDVWGLNYEFHELDFARASAPTGCVVATECANLPYARRGHWPAEAEQVVVIRDAVQRMENAGPGAAGWALWCFADYATPRRQRWFRECGVLDGWRTPKMASDWLRARCRPDQPFLSVRGDWSFAAGLRRRLYLVTNCTEVRIYRGADLLRLLPAPVPDLYEIDLDFNGFPVRFAGSHANGAVETQLVPWGTAAGFELRTERISPELVGCRLQVADATGVPVFHYEGEARVHLPLEVRASLVGGTRVPVHAGQAVFFVESAGITPQVVAECALDDFPVQRICLFPDGGVP